VAPGRALVRAGTVRARVGGRDDGAAPEAVELYVFTDLLMYGSRTSSNKLMLHRLTPLHEVTVAGVNEEWASASSEAAAFRITTSDRTIDFFVDTKEDVRVKIRFPFFFFCFV
jgi:hypothetical protein